MILDDPTMSDSLKKLYKKELKNLTGKYVEAINIIKGLGVDIAFTELPQIRSFAYSPELNLILMNKEFMKQGDDHPNNIAMACHALFHELGHAIFCQIYGDEIKYDDEEEWCDKFATEMCEKIRVHNTDVFEDAHECHEIQDDFEYI